MSTIAVFIALGGSAVAAKSLVNGKSIKRHSIPGNRLKNHSITKPQLGVSFLAVSDAIRAGDLTGTYGAPRLAQATVSHVADNPYTPGAPDPCTEGRTAVFCGLANGSGSQRGWYDAGAPFGRASYWRDPYGVVHLSGEFQAGAPQTQTVFILPVGYRPQHEVQYSIARDDTQQDVEDTTVLEVDPSGAVIERLANAQHDQDFSLEGITYPTH